MDKFSGRIKDIRHTTGLSQNDFGKKIGVAQQTVYNWEHDKATPDPAMLVRICVEYDVSADYLLGMSDEGSALQPPAGTVKISVLDDWGSSERYFTSEQLAPIITEAKKETTSPVLKSFVDSLLDIHQARKILLQYIDANGKVSETEVSQDKIPALRKLIKE